MPAPKEREIRHRRIGTDDDDDFARINLEGAMGHSVFKMALSL